MKTFPSCGTWRFWAALLNLLPFYFATGAKHVVHFHSYLPETIPLLGCNWIWSNLQWSSTINISPLTLTANSLEQKRNQEHFLVHFCRRKVILQRYRSAALWREIWLSKSKQKMDSHIVFSYALLNKPYTAIFKQYAKSKMVVYKSQLLVVFI